MLGRLVEQSGERVGRVYLLGSAVTTIGRGDDNDFVVAGDYVSTHHAEVRWVEEQYILYDCGSTNGTRLNGTRLTAPHALVNGDRIELPGQPGVTLLFTDGSRTAQLPPEEPRAADTRLDLDTAELWVRGERVHTTAKEHRALVVLFERGGALVSKEELAARVWPELEGQVSDANVEQLIARLRRKLDGDAAHPPLLLTVRGLGYRLVLP